MPRRSRTAAKPATRAGRRCPVVGAGRVVGDQVDVEPVAAQQVGQLFGQPVAVVDPVQHQVLDEDAPPGDLAVAAAGGDQLGQREPARDGHQLRAQPIVGSVQRQRQLDLQRLGRQPLDAGYPPGRRDRDLARTQAEAGRVVEGAAGREHRVVVQERLAHAHHHHVGHPLALLAQHRRQHRHLLRDLAGGQVAAKAHAAGGAEGACQRAARLRRDADGAPVAMAHRDRLDREAVTGGEAQLDGAVGGPLRLDRFQLAQRLRIGETAPESGRQRGQLLVVAGQALHHALVDLPLPVLRLAPFLHQRVDSFEIHGW